VNAPDAKRPKLEPVARDPELWQALGQLTVYYANLEDQLKFSIWTMSGSPARSASQDVKDQQIAQIMMAGRPFSGLVDIFCSLCKLHFADERRLKLVTNDLERVSRERNEYVHSNWSWGYKPGAILRYRHTARARRGLDYKQEDVTPADIRALADGIGFVTLRVAGIFHGEDFHKGLWDDEQRVNENAQTDDLGPQYISPKYTVEKISPGTLTDWIDVWEDRLWGWWLEHAHRVRGDRNAGFLIVHLAVGIIETFEVAWKGEDSENRSREFFRDGFLRIFALPPDSTLTPGDVADLIYTAVRCGLTHTAMLKGPVFLIDDDRFAAVSLLKSPDGSITQVAINPAKCLDSVVGFYRQYVRQLREGKRSDADERRRRFEDAWHLLHARPLPPPRRKQGSTNP